jgi:HTH-type transcriptional regulator / antitoxin HigA
MQNTTKTGGKMTHTIDRSIYLKLLAKVTPKIIENELEYQETLAEVEKLFFNKNRTMEEDALYELLVILVEKYESENHSLDTPKPLEILQHLMDTKGITESDLIVILGDQKIVTEIIKGQSLINVNQADILANYFQVSPHLFLNAHYK